MRKDCRKKLQSDENKSKEQDDEPKEVGALSEVSDEVYFEDYLECGC